MIIICLFSIYFSICWFSIAIYLKHNPLITYLYCFILLRIFLFSHILIMNLYAFIRMPINYLQWILHLTLLIILHLTLLIILFYGFFCPHIVLKLVIVHFYYKSFLMLTFHILNQFSYPIYLT